ncbi:MAG: DNA polymerase domain-containing protein [Anaerolineales bacterium]
MGLNDADGGGLNYRPLVGVHRQVAELDFFSMYPSIMESWNISGETVGVEGKETRYVPQNQVPIRQDVPGLVASVLRPLLKKRYAVKQVLRSLAADDPQGPILQAISDACKWLGYVSFGYQGYKNNLFGNIQAHEAICAIGRESLVVAIEAAHEMGFKVLAANVDSLFVQKAGARLPVDFQALMEEIDRRTGLVIELDGIFDWLIFTASKINPRIGAANRYFGKFDHGDLKVRGMAQRRSDTPNWIIDAEHEIMALLGSEVDGGRLTDYVPEIIAKTKRYFSDLDAERVPLEDLVCRNKMAKALEEYTGVSPAAKAARQLAAAGKQVRVGQRVDFIYIHGQRTSVYPWDHPVKPDYTMVSKKRYKELLLRAVGQILSPLGMSEEELADLAFDGVKQLPLWPDEGDWDEFNDELLEEEPSLAEALFAPYTLSRNRRESRQG